MISKTLLKNSMLNKNRLLYKQNYINFRRFCQKINPEEMTKAEKINRAHRQSEPARAPPNKVGGKPQPQGGYQKPPTRWHLYLYALSLIGLAGRFVTAKL